MGKGAALPEPGDTVAEKYRIECTIGTGGMSVVFGATHLITGRRFAIKWMCPEAGNDARESTQRFIREAQVAGRFAHPNVVEVYDVGQVEGAYFMVMEWLEGESLAARLDRGGPLSFQEACDLLIPCMYGIDDAHSAGIVHRDLKPANIFLCPATRHAPARAKVLDFGIAKLTDQARRDSSPDDHDIKFNPVVTQVGTLMGTPYYLAPEQLRNHPADRRTDVYAFGVMLYQVLAGRVPFTGNTFADLVVQISSLTPQPLRELARELPPQVEAVVARAMARDPDERFQDLRSLAGALEAIQHAALDQVRVVSSARLRTSAVRAASGVSAGAAVAALRTYPGGFDAPPPEPEPSGPYNTALPLSQMHTSGVRLSGRFKVPGWAWWCGAGVLFAVFIVAFYKRLDSVDTRSEPPPPQQVKRPAVVAAPRPSPPTAARPSAAPAGYRKPGTVDMYQAATAQDRGAGAVSLPRGSEGPPAAVTAPQAPNAPAHASPASRKRSSPKAVAPIAVDVPEPEPTDDTATETRRAPPDTHRKRPVVDDFDSDEDLNPLQGMRLQ